MPMSGVEHSFVGTGIVLIGFLGVIVNCMLVSSIYNRYVKAQRKVNCLLVNLIVSNFGLIFFAFPFPMLASFKNTWFWGDSWCTYYGSVSLLFGFSMMISVVMLCFDMLLKNTVANYEAYKYKVREFMLVWVWMNCIFWSIAPLCGWSRISYEPSMTSCSLDVLHPENGYKSYIISCFLICYILPVLSMIICRIKLKSSSKKAAIKQDPENYRKIMILIVLFVIEWTPYSIIYLWPVFNDPSTIPLRFSAAAPLFAKLAVIFTPLVFLKENWGKCLK